MASINRLKRELVFKIVFYGPGLGGKTTSLRHIHTATNPENRGNLISLATDTDRTLYFDYLPIKLVKLGDMGVKLQLYTVPGQVYYAATRKLVLSGADGIVFVADTQTARYDSNQESLDDLNLNLAEQGRKLSRVPHVFQWNKRDLPALVAVDELDRRLNLFGAPAVPTIATSGQGIFDILERITRLVVEGYRADLPGVTRNDGFPLFLDAEEMGLALAIKGLADSQPGRVQASARREAALPAVMAPIEGTLPSHTLSSAPTPAPLRARSPQQPAAGPPADLGPSEANGLAFTFAEIWPGGDRDVVRRIERALSARDAVAAIAACEILVARVLAGVWTQVGDAKRSPDPATLVMLLGLDGPRYIEFLNVVRAARSQPAPTLHDALGSYAFALQARLAFDRTLRDG
jgi:mutual gliding-motility protein MglA